MNYGFGIHGIKRGMVTVASLGARKPYVGCTVLEIGKHFVMGSKLCDRKGAGDKIEEYKVYTVKSIIGNVHKVNEFKVPCRAQKAISKIDDLFGKDSEIDTDKLLKISSSVSVKGISKGKGFVGMVTLGCRRGPASHGSSKFHYAQGSTGTRRKPTKVLKGKLMPRRQGFKTRTSENLSVREIVEINNRKYLVVNGSVPGVKNTTNPDRINIVKFIFKTNEN